MLVQAAVIVDAQLVSEGLDSRLLSRAGNTLASYAVILAIVCFSEAFACQEEVRHCCDALPPDNVSIEFISHRDNYLEVNA